MAIYRQESVLFDETDQDNEEEKITYANKSQVPNQYMPAQSDSPDQASSSLMEPKSLKKSVKLVDKTRRAFSISIESSKAFELAIRKPRRKLKHYYLSMKGFLYGIYLMLMKHHGGPPYSHEINYWLIAYSLILSLDIMVFSNYCIHMITPMQNFYHFGWAFVLIYFMLPYLSPICAIVAAITGSPELMRSYGNMNALIVLVNIPLTTALGFYYEDDLVNLLLLSAMVFIKISLSWVSSKVMQNLLHPRFSKNHDKLIYILFR